MIFFARAVVAAVKDRDGVLARRITEECITTRTLGMIEVHLALTAAGGDESLRDLRTPRPTVEALPRSYASGAGE